MPSAKRPGAPSARSTLALRSRSCSYLAYRDAHETSYASMEAKFPLGQLLLRRGGLERASDWFAQARAEATPVVEALRDKLTKQAPKNRALPPERLLRRPLDRRRWTTSHRKPRTFAFAGGSRGRAFRHARVTRSLHTTWPRCRAASPALDRRLTEALRAGRRRARR